MSGGYCTWCVKSEQLQSCSSCKLLFCRNCLSKNFGEEGLLEARVAGWQCCCCLPSQLEHLISDCDKALGGVESSDPENDFAELSVIESNGPFRYALYHCIVYFITILCIWFTITFVDVD